ncbi:hypothetical protein ZTR_08256 [Talaromyces verruculosus]|nr:hypothetical protein ZTR_08256 [Talaromyces verruculosus]
MRPLNSAPFSQPLAEENDSKGVIITGAGPVGLMIALKLGMAGISVNVIEKNTGLSQQPRACGYHGAALAALKRTPVYKEAVELGFFGNGICWRKPLIEDGGAGTKMGDIIASLVFASNEETQDEHGNGVLYLPQPKLTELFYKAALQTGFVKVHFAHELCEIHDSEDSVTAVAQRPTGESKKFKGIFLVGADGGKSTTRKILNIPFKGHSWPERIVATDVLLEDKFLDPIFPTSMPFGALGLTTGLLDADAVADTLIMIMNEDKPVDLLNVYSDERKRVFQTFVDPMSSQNKLRCASEAEIATEDWFLRAVVKKTPEILEAFGSEMNHNYPKKYVATLRLRGSSYYELGLQHGQQAKEQIYTNIKTYITFFQETSGMKTWEEAKERSKIFVPTLKELYPETLEEMRGIAEGARLDMGDILALNVRSEIGLTNYPNTPKEEPPAITDGCTSIVQRSQDGSTVVLAQNWDWLEQLHDGMFMNEAGLVGKIGVNSHGVGICMNALRCGALSTDRLPTHVMCRRVLGYAKTFEEAVAMLDQYGCACAFNLAVADVQGKFATVEITPNGLSVIKPLSEDDYTKVPGKGPNFVAHTNHVMTPPMEFPE